MTRGRVEGAPSIHQGGKGDTMHRTLTLLAAMLIAGTLATVAMAENASLHDVLEEQKDPSRAMLLSALLPGLGQYYNEDYALGALFQAGHAVGVYAASFGLFLAKGNNELLNLTPGGDIGEKRWVWVGTGFTVATTCYIASIVHAGSSSRAINRKAAQARSHLLQFDHGDNLLGFDVGATRDGGPVVVLAYEF